MKPSVIVLLLLSGSLFFSPPTWYQSLSDAQSIAKELERPILLVFSGSDWCRPCMKLEQEVLSQPNFQQFAAAELVLLKADFPRKRKNKLSSERLSAAEELAEHYNPKGMFPTLLLLNASGEITSSLSYQGEGSAEFIARIKAASSL
ncbi:MAG: thioredoxin family protein [Bacteroidota bacterium]